MQIAVFKNPNITSSVTGNLKATKARGGILCDLISAPQMPQSSAALRNGQWEEVANISNAINSGGKLVIELDDEDNATFQLISAIRNNKVIEEIAVYELNTTDNKEQYGYYFHKVFVNKVRQELHESLRFIELDCQVISFREKDNRNNENVLWDWNTQDYKYTGAMR